MDAFGGKGKGKKGKEPAEGEPSDNLYVQGLPEQFDTDAVQQFFGAIGNVVQCKSFGNGYALVRLASLQEAMTVKMSLHGQMPIGCSKPMSITFALAEGKADWACPGCGDIQFQKNTHCRKCGQARPKEGEPGFGAPAVFTAWGKGKYAKGEDGQPSPYAKGAGKVKGPQCNMAEFMSELIAGGLPGGDQDPSLNCIYIGGLPADTTTESLYQIFGTFGSIPPKGTTVEKTPDGQCVGWGLVNFIESTSADMAVMALNGIATADGSKLEVRKK